MDSPCGEKGRPAIYIYHLKECDPSKCTAQRLGKMGLARVTHRLQAIPSRALLLYPSTETLVSPDDRQRIGQWGIAAIDCSWNRLRKIGGIERYHVRQLPFLLAGNPVNYAMPRKLSTVEAISAALIIAGFSDFAVELLSKFKWGSTFLSLNRELLSQYSAARSHDEVKRVSEEYGDQYSPQIR
jgi:rRNA small subunit aminocarboxypropyltransferase